MTSASAQDRVARAELLLREAQLGLVKAQDNLDECYAAWLEAKVLLRPGLDIATEDIRSVAERYADREAARVERSDAP